MPVFYFCDLGLQDIRNFALAHPKEIILLDLSAGPALVQPGITDVPIDDARIPVFAALILGVLGDLMFYRADMPSENPTIDELLSVTGNKNLIFIVGDERLPLEDPRFIISFILDTFEPRENPEMLFESRDDALQTTFVNNPDDVVLVRMYLVN